MSAIVGFNENKGSIIIQKFMSKETYEKEVSFEDLDKIKRWHLGEGLIQNMLPHWTSEEREELLTGMSSDQWNDLFKDDD